MRILDFDLPQDIEDAAIVFMKAGEFPRGTFGLRMLSKGINDAMRGMQAALPENLRQWAGVAALALVERELSAGRVVRVVAAGEASIFEWADEDEQAQAAAHMDRRWEIERFGYVVGDEVEKILAKRGPH